MRQTLAVIAMNLTALRTRLGSSIIVVVTMVLLAGIGTSMFSIATGMMRSLDTLRQSDLVMLTSDGAQSEFQSSIPRSAALTIADAPEIKKGAGDKPLAAPAMLGNIRVTTRDGYDRGIPIRGTSPMIFEMRRTFRMVEGRMFTPGRRELVVGREARDALEGLDLNDKVQLPDGAWPIVGVFESHGRGDWELYGDAETLMPAFRRNAFHSVTVELADPNTFGAFKARLKADPTLSVLVERVADYLDRTSGPQETFYKVIAYLVGGIVAAGVVFAAANMMYAAVSRRIVEIATLRAIGFGATAVIFSVIAEGLILAAIGAAIGIFCAWTAFDGVNYTAGGFHLAVTTRLALASLTVTLGVGLLSALFPAIRAARLPVAMALQVR